MHLYEKSEELVSLLEQRVREERNDSNKSQYQFILQQQRNASATLKTLGEAYAQNQGNGTTTANDGTATTAYSTEFATETFVDPNSINTKAVNDANAKKGTNK